METTAILRTNLENVLSRIEKAALRSGRKPDEITLVAVTKTVDAGLVERLVGLGVRNIGENRVQDAQGKKEILSGHSHLVWHMIGNLQKNKVKSALHSFHLLHAIDTLPLAQEIDRRTDRKFPVLLEVNVSQEASKHGFSVEELERSMEKLLSLPGVDVQGLMTMAPFTDDMGVCRNCFSKLRELSENLKRRYGVLLRHLSMGMSQDYEIAVEEGATFVRVGSELFKGI